MSRYLLTGWLGAAAVLIAVLLTQRRDAAPHVAGVGTMAVWFVAFLWCRRLTVPYAVAPNPVRTASLVARRESVPGGILGMALPFLILAAKGIEYRLRWDAIPAKLPVHWGLNGADRWVDRTQANVYGMLLAVGATCALTIVAAWSIAHRSRTVSTVDGNAAPEQRFRRYGVYGLTALAWAFAAAFPPVPNMYLNLPYPAAWVGGISLLTVFLLIVSGQGGTRLPGYRPLTAGDTPTGDRTADAYWRLGTFYFNRNDPALIVEKRFGLGWTFNFANPWSWAILALILSLPAAHLLVR